MRTDESVIKEVKSNRKKLFYKLYFIPWILLTVCLFVSIFYLWFENERLQEVNFRLVKKIQAQQIIVSWPQNYKNEVTDKNDEIEEESKESEESFEVSEVEKNDFEKERDAAQRRGYIEDSEVSKFEETENSEVSKFAGNEVSEVSEVSEELLELHILKRRFDNEGIRVRSYRDSVEIREDFGDIRTWGYNRENYIYAEEFGIRMEVQLIKSLEDILEKEIGAWDEIFISKNKRDIFERELKYKINENVLNQFRVYWEINKNK